MVLAASIAGCSQASPDGPGTVSNESNPANHKREEVHVSSQDSFSELPVRQESSDLPANTENGTEREDEKNRQIRLNIPESIQETGYWCAPACLQMVLAYHGLDYSQKELASLMNTSSVTGTEYEDLARAATDLIFTKREKAGQYREVIFKPSDDDYRSDFEKRVIADLENGDPVFASINNAQMYKDVGNQVHEIVIYGIDLDEQGRIVSCCYLDPSSLRTTAYGQKYIVTADEMWNAMLNNPEPGYVY